MNFCTRAQIVNRIFLCMWILAVPTCMAVIAVFGYNQVWLCVSAPLCLCL